MKAIKAAKMIVAVVLILNIFVDILVLFITKNLNVFLIYTSITLGVLILLLIIIAFESVLSNQEKIMIHLKIIEAPKPKETQSIRLVKPKKKVDKHIREVSTKQVGKSNTDVYEKTNLELDNVYYSESLDKTVLTIKRNKEGFVCKDLENGEIHLLSIEDLI